MSRLGFMLVVVAIAGCAALERPKPLTGLEVVALAREGKTPPQIIEILKRTDTVLPLQASDFVTLHQSGVPNEVLDYLQRAQIEELRWRERQLNLQWVAPGHYRGPGFAFCPRLPLGVMHPYHGPWSC